MIEKNTWVCLRRTVLAAEERAPGIPADTAGCPLMVWVRGALLSNAEVGSEATVRTRTGRVERGFLEEVQPQYSLGYGDFIPELQQIGSQARDILFGGDHRE